MQYYPVCFVVLYRECSFLEVAIFFCWGKSPTSARVRLTFFPSSHLEYLGMTRAFFSFAIMCDTISNGRSMRRDNAIFWPLAFRHQLFFAILREKKWRHIWWNLRCTLGTPTWAFPMHGKRFLLTSPENNYTNFSGRQTFTDSVHLKVLSNETEEGGNWYHFDIITPDRTL